MGSIGSTYITMKMLCNRYEKMSESKENEGWKMSTLFNNKDILNTLAKQIKNIYKCIISMA